MDEQFEDLRPQGQPRKTEDTLQHLLGGDTLLLEAAPQNEVRGWLVCLEGNIPVPGIGLLYSGPVRRCRDGTVLMDYLIAPESLLRVIANRRVNLIQKTGSLGWNSYTLRADQHIYADFPQSARLNRVRLLPPDHPEAAEPKPAGERHRLDCDRFGKIKDLSPLEKEAQRILQLPTPHDLLHMLRALPSDALRQEARAWIFSDGASRRSYALSGLPESTGPAPRWKKFPWLLLRRDHLTSLGDWALTGVSVGAGPDQPDLLMNYFRLDLATSEPTARASGVLVLFKDVAIYWGSVRLPLPGARTDSLLSERTMDRLGDLMSAPSQEEAEKILKGEIPLAEKTVTSSSLIVTDRVQTQVQLLQGVSGAERAQRLVALKRNDRVLYDQVKAALAQSHKSS